MTSAEHQDQQKAIAHWLESALRDRDAARNLLKLKHYDWSLFVFHLAIEKLLKALIIATEQTPPFSHDLERLAQLTDLKLADEQKEQLREITKYNIEARYPEEKLSLYHKATAEYTAVWQRICEDIFIWLEQTLSPTSKR
jgi:HEPN domain-containing protein